MKSKILILAVFLTAMGCGGKDDQPQPAPPEPPSTQVPAPGAASLISPARDEACTAGTIISDDKSKITFTWNTADHADSYELVIKNLLTGTKESHAATGTKLEVTLSRNTPYSWYVVSKSSKSKETAKSDTWKFYNAGAGMVSYAPFPADLTSPSYGQQVTASKGTVDLKWSGKDVDGDIAGYDVYFGTNTSPDSLKGDVKDMFLKNVKVKSGKTYYWKIVTKDAKGNTSESEVSQFTVK